MAASSDARLERPDVGRPAPPNEPPAGDRAGGSKPTRSTDVDWTRRNHEWFREGGIRIDVSMVKRHLSRAALPIREVPRGWFRAWSRTGEGEPTDGPRMAVLDPRRVRTADPSIPVLVLFARRLPFLIDGHHRLERARLLGKENVPAIVIDDERLARAASRATSRRLAYWWLWNVRGRWPGRETARPPGR